MDSTQATANVQVIGSLADRVVQNVEKVILGKRREVEMTIIALLCEGHLLIEDVPGVGKTMLARAIAKSIGCSFRRIQFTPDMLPSDVTGVSMFNQRDREFEFRPGPIMAQIVLADEINRATPKTQSALLEAMEERQVTVDGRTYPMERPFLVLATQNPIEYEGTFPLPEAQIDRFMMRVSLGYPSPADEMRVLESQREHHPLQDLGQVVSAEELIEAQAAVAPDLRGRPDQGIHCRAGKRHPPPSRHLPGRQPTRQPGACSGPRAPTPPCRSGLTSSRTTSRHCSKPPSPIA